MSEVKICPTCGSEYPVSERFCPRDGSALRSQSASADLVGAMIADRYHVIKKLGEGGMGAVYLAEHVKMGRKSAIKVMNPGMNQDSDAIARFNREASNASRMNHPNICAIYDFGETSEGLIYLAMEFIEGESLTALIERNGALPPSRASSILHQAADALQVAHDYGIVHRDLKPDNIMIAKGRDNTDLVKVVDFGIAKAHTSDAQKVTKTGLVVGTPEYMSPEQLAGDKLDGRSDIYSLALVGFNMLTGTLPFPSNSAQEAMIMRLTDQPKTLADMKPNFAWPEEVQAVFDKALARDVNERYQKAADFGRDLSMAIEKMPATVMAEAGTQVIGAQASPNAATAAIPRTRVADKSPARGAPAHTPVKSAMGKMMGVGAVIVIVLGGGVYYFGFMNKDDGAGAGNTVATVDSAAIKAAADSVRRADSIRNAANANPRNPGRGQTDRGGNSGRGNQTTPPPVVDPPANNNPPTAPTVASLLTKYDRMLTEDVSKSSAQDALFEIADALPRAVARERGRMYLFQGFFYNIVDDDSKRACASVQKAKAEGLTGNDLNLANQILAECASVPE